MGGAYGLGILCAYSYNRIMVNVSQGTMRNLRIELFRHMESLPIRYFDTHAHGDIMSVYTNDVDTLRQLMSQSIPQVVNSSVITIVSLLCEHADAGCPADPHHTGGSRESCSLSPRGLPQSSSMYFARQQKRSGQCERLYRGDDGRTEGRQGILP